MDRPMDRPVMAVRSIRYWDGSWHGWDLDWSAVWTGALTMLVAAAMFSLIAVAVGAQKAVGGGVVHWADVPIVTIAFSVFGAFLPAAAGAYVAAPTSAPPLPHPAILHPPLAR